MKIIAILALSIALSGCGLFKKPTDAVITEKVVYIDPRALIPCDDLVVPDIVSFESLLTSAVANAELYLDCRNKQDNSIKLLKEFANQKERK